MKSAANEYFELYTGTAGAALLANLPNEPVPHWENEHREFKSGHIFNAIIDETKTKQERQTAENKLRAAWSEVVGAFSNTGGGVVVFGIHSVSRKEYELKLSVDRPQAVTPVRFPKALITRLKAWARDDTDPPANGIIYEIVWREEAANEAFVVCLIPEGTQKPYRSKEASREFYQRHDDNCISISTPFLRQLFYPQRSPRLRVTLKEVNVEWIHMYGVVEHKDGVYVSVYRIVIYNRGLTSLKEPLVSVEPRHGKIFTYSADHGDDLEYSPRVYLHQHGERMKGTMHPGITFTLTFLLETENATPNNQIALRVYSDDNPILIAVFPLMSEAADAKLDMKVFTPKDSH